MMRFGNAVSYASQHISSDMTKSDWNTLITAIHASKHQCVLAITGGGSSAIARLLEVPGGSRTVLEAVVPYSSAALTDWLGGAPDQFCAEPTARAMAMAAWMRARALSPEADPRRLIGVGATASLASDRPKKGDHRIHIAAQTATATSSYSLVLAKDQRKRLAEENIASQLVLMALAEACQLDGEMTAGLAEHLLPNEQIICATEPAEPAWTDLLLGKRNHVCYPEPFAPQAVFPGAFNPLHTGHRRMAEIAGARLGCPVAYELSITNVDKRPLDFVEIGDRLRDLQDDAASAHVLLTDAPTFRTKAALFPGCTFVVGADTIARIADPRYYTGADGSFDAAIAQVADRGCRFLVFGREFDGRFHALSDLTLPPALRQLCDEVPKEEFREDISSTEVRAQTEV